ncbi:MAG: PAS domain-containing sensor histidine kinase [Cyclobacteriaceae bacterium]
MLFFFTEWLVNRPVSINTDAPGRKHHDGGRTEQFVALRVVKNIYVPIGFMEEQNLNTCAASTSTLRCMLKEGIFRTNGQKEVSYANQAILKMFGYDLLPQSPLVWDDLLANERDAIYINDRLNAEGKITDFRVLFKKRDGANFWGLLSCHLAERSGVQVLEGAIIDISGQVAQEIRFNEKTSALEKTNLELDRFIYSASHDIRSPISTVLGLIGLMKLEFREPKATELIDMMDASMKKLDFFVKELSSFAKNSRQEIQEIRVDTTQVINTILQEFERDHKAYSKVKIKVSAPHTTSLRSDPERLHIILNQILRNALDFCDLSKPSRLVDIQIVVNNEKATFEIFDNGIGIAASHIDNAFDMFYKGTVLSKGAGLGLYIARETVIKLGGVISLNSKVGVGTTVKIEIPNQTTGPREARNKA